LKAAILGTEDYHATMREIVDTSLRRRINYVPQRMSVDSNCILPPVHADYLPQVDLIMQKLADDNELVNCNPRSAYLMLAWLLMGSDNEYRTCLYVDMLIPKQVAIILIRIALGNTPLSVELKAVARAVDEAKWASQDTYWFAWNGVWAVARAATSAADRDRITFRVKGIAEFAAAAIAVMESVAKNDGIADGVVKTTISSKARQWAHISDEEALQIARQLTLDILSL
jgi:hypothetical protein